MKIRLHGTADECRHAADAIATVLDIVAISDPYPDRGRSSLVRVYLDTRPPTAASGKPASAGVNTEPGSSPLRTARRPPLLGATDGTLPDSTTRAYRRRRESRR